MSNKVEEDIIRQYVERVLSVSERDEKLSSDELKAIVREIGLDDVDLEAVDKHVSNARRRAENFLVRKLYDDAIHELKDVHVFQPDDVENLQSLCSAYGGRYFAKGEESDRVDARRVASQVLTLDPNRAEVYGVLSRLEEGFNRQEQPLVVVPKTSDGRGSAAQRNLIIVSLVSIVALVAVSGFVLSSTSAPMIVEAASDDLPITPPVKPGEFPVAIAALPDGVDVEIVKTKVDVYPNSTFYRFSGFLVSNGDQELEKVNARFRYTLADGNTFVRDVRGLDTHEVSLRPGDKKAFFELNKIDGSPLKSLGLEMTVEQSLKNVGDYPESKPIAITWDVDQAGFELNVRERQFLVSNSSRDWHSSNIEWEITNTGTRPIKKLKLASTLMAEDGSILDKTSHIVTFSSRPPIAANQTRLANDLYMKSDGRRPARYTLRVEEIE